MIPKIIHYCWFGENEISEEYAQYISGWRHIHPDWELKEWNDQNYSPDVPYFSKARSLGNHANMSNYCRLDVLLKHGGVYMDTDVLLLKPFDQFTSHSCFLAFEDENKETGEFWLNNAVMGSIRGHPFVKMCLDAFVDKFDGSEDANESSPALVTEILRKEYQIDQYGHAILRDDILLLEKEVFYPFSWKNASRRYSYQKYVTPNTVAVHMWGRTWYSRDKLVGIIDELQDWAEVLEAEVKRLTALADEREIHLLEMEQQLNRASSIENNLDLLTQVVSAIAAKLDGVLPQSQPGKTFESIDAALNLLDGIRNGLQNCLDRTNQVVSDQESFFSKATGEVNLLNVYLSKLIDEDAKRLIHENSIRLLYDKFAQLCDKHESKLNALDILEAQYNGLEIEMVNAVKRASEREAELLQRIELLEDKDSEKELECNRRLNEIHGLNKAIRVLSDELTVKNQQVQLLETELIDFRIKEERYQLAREESERVARALQEDIEWYQRTYENRTFLGVLKEKFSRRRPPKPTKTTR